MPVASTCSPTWDSPPPPPAGATAYLALAIVHLQWNDVDEAQMLLAEARAASALEITPRWATELAQIRLNASLGLVAAAREDLGLLRDGLDDWDPPPFLARWWTITEAEVELAAGDPAAALVRLDSGPALDPSSSQAPERICRSRALLALGDPQAADEVLAALRDGRRQHGCLVEMWLLTALAAGRLREDGRATDAVRRALHAAETEGVRRPFVTLDEERLPRLLLRAKEMQLGSGQFLDSVLEDLGTVARRPPSSSSLPVPLTDRELSVLLFLPTMMTFGEIADELYVSINTVKSHVRSIYAKFDVTSRRRAVQRAHELGLLST
ncbi:MAG: helix-turn-helix transcriptional regulator [Ornithinibacter sp.]|nr:helix-turn-helix transcriptional regulator [Ornithinibacter sp.]